MTKTQEGYLLIADITGYTMYLSQSELDHAQEILTTLLELLLEHTKPPLILSRLAGDAVISYGLRGSFFQGQTFLEMIEDTYVAFRKAIDQMVLNNTCQCKACANISTLDLKFFVHYGTFAIQNISDHDELVGSDVNLLHRLLKNHVTEKTGLPAYTLYTDAALKQLGIDGLQETMTQLEEEYEHLGVVQVWVQDMHPVWQEKRSATQITIAPEEVIIRAEAEIDLPAELVWDFLADPEYRNTLMGSTRQEVLHRSHGRVAPGSVYQCIHGNRTTSLTILEWHPFERVLMHTAMPIPGASCLTEMRLEPTEHGTRLIQVITRTKGSLPARLVCDMVLRSMAKAAQSDMAAFKKLVETDHANRSHVQRDPVAANAAA